MPSSGAEIHPAEKETFDNKAQSIVDLALKNRKTVPQLAGVRLQQPNFPIHPISSFQNSAGVEAALAVSLLWVGCAPLTSSDMMAGAAWLSA
jgi:hypothetical protein